VKAAAKSPAEERFVTSVVKRYEEIAAFAEKMGAIKTHIFLILMVKWKRFNAQ